MSDFSRAELSGHVMDYQEDDAVERMEYAHREQDRNDDLPYSPRCRYCWSHPRMDQIGDSVYECPVCCYEVTV